MDDSANSFDVLVSESLDNLRATVEPGEKISGTVTSISKNNVFVDVSAKSEGIVDRAELAKHGLDDVDVGSTLETYVIGFGDGGEILLSVNMAANEAGEEAIADAFAAKIPVEGKVIKERKGGFEVQVGRRSGFCPYSQIDLFTGGDNASYCGQRFSFLITEFNRSNLVLSRRKILELEAAEGRKHLRDTLKVNDIIEGMVKKIMNFGVFVDLGGMDGLIPKSELSWARIDNPDDSVRIGEMITVRVINLDWDSERITLEHQASRW